MLKMLRDGEADDVETLCRAFGLDSNYVGSFYVKNVLRHLADAGLITPKGSARKPSSDFSGKLEITAKWPAIREALGISLTRLSEMSDQAIAVTPYFGKPARIALDIFVLMSFNPVRRPIYDDHISNVAARLSLVAKRADDFFTTHYVMADVWGAIWSARVIIADCTDRNPNVFYEIGVAHTLGKPVVLVTQDSKDVPFDLQAIRYIPYEFTPRGMTQFEERLEATLKAELQISI